MTPGDKEFGELIGEVRGLASAVELMRTENAADHENVTRRLDAIDTKLDSKAPVHWVREVDGRLGSLENDRAERKGKLIVVAALLTLVVCPAIVGVFLMAVGVFG